MAKILAAAGVLFFVSTILFVCIARPTPSAQPFINQLAAPFMWTEAAMGTQPDRLLPAERAPRAPALADGVWINSDPLKLENLHGRVVLVDFWTFACYNCRNTLPALKRWDARYRERGLTIIGVHTPELERERDLDNLRREVRALGIRYAVVTDNDYATWKAYGVEAWPTIVILDKQGRIRGAHVGEGGYDEIESAVQKLLAE